MENPKHAPLRPPAESDDFTSLGISAPLHASLLQAGYNHPTLIQKKTIPPLLDGRDVVILSQTGSGKTAAFVIPALHRLIAAKPQDHAARILILAPTRELAIQTASVCRQLGRRFAIRTRTLCGGVSKAQQLASLSDGADIIVATHGRLLDLVTEGQLSLTDIDYLVLDEADRLLDAEFSASMQALAAHLPSHPQTVFCSATFPEPVVALAKTIMRDPAILSVEEESFTPHRIRQRAIFLENDAKASFLRENLSLPTAPKRCILFVRTKKTADLLAKTLRRGKIAADALHGDLNQKTRQKILSLFRAGTINALVTTDIAARGLDIAEIALVVNVDMPETAETYIHRIGRTARIGKKGAALSLVASEERFLLRDIERHIRHRIRIVTAEAPGL